MAEHISFTPVFPKPHIGWSNFPYALKFKELPSDVNLHGLTPFTAFFHPLSRKLKVTDVMCDGDAKKKNFQTVQNIPALVTESRDQRDILVHANCTCKTWWHDNRHGCTNTTLHKR